MTPSSSSLDHMFLPIAALSASGVVLLGMSQTDFMSRKLLNPQRLLVKRHQEFAYRWKTALEKATFQQNVYLGGSVDAVQSDPEWVAKQTAYLSNEEELQEMAKNMTNSKSKTKMIPLRIDQDKDDPTGGYYVYLMERGISSPEDEREIQPARLLQVPVASFSKVLKEAFENSITTTALCFVADASAGTASKLIEELVVESKSGVAVASQPLWMANLAYLSDRGALTKQVTKDLLFSLCRLEAWALRDKVKESHTVLFSLPGQTTTPILLPMLQEVFPEDRHVFAYDGCVASVKRGIKARKQSPRAVLPKTVDEATSMSQAVVQHTTPLRKTSLCKTVRNLDMALSQIPVSQAEIVESWMASVDTFFLLKEEDATNGYLPYTFRMTFLTEPTQADFSKESDSYWSLCSLLQYVTGCRSRPLPEGVIDSAIEWLRDYNDSSKKTGDFLLTFSTAERKAIENCVFKHKQILIGDKTLQDTVLPRQHWTLKQASKKGGCACCGPDPFDEDEEEEEANRAAASSGLNTSGPDMTVPGAFTSAFTTNGNNGTSLATSSKKPGTTGYVDGKMGFAFDPTKFS